MSEPNIDHEPFSMVSLVSFPLKIAIFETSNGRISDPDDPKNLKIEVTYFVGTYFQVIIMNFFNNNDLICLFL